MKKPAILDNSHLSRQSLSLNHTDNCLFPKPVAKCAPDQKTITLAQITVWSVSDLQWHPHELIQLCGCLHHFVHIFTKCTQWQQSHSTWFKGFFGAVTMIAFHLVYLILIFLVIKKAWNVDTLLFFTLAYVCVHHHGLRCLHSGSH